MSFSASSFNLRIAYFVILISGLAWYGWHLASHQPSVTELDDKPLPPSSVQIDPEEIFKRAFWKRPSETDQILHAERREWADATGVQKWQWFISVQPSAELVQHLITENAFALTSQNGLYQPTDADFPPPDWFPAITETTPTLRSPTGSLTLVWNEKENLLLAMDSGAGFYPGAPEVPQTIVQMASTGRLPRTPPPDPPKP